MDMGFIERFVTPAKMQMALLACLLAFSISEARAQAWRDMPYYLKGYEAEYARSPKEAALAWFKDARFGLFVHWGPATLYGRNDEWVMFYEKIPVKEYEQKAREFKGENFRAQDYVDLALAAKMKYITFVIKHHDGFALWDTRATDYNSMDYPAGRDFLKELAEACRKIGLGLFIYYSIGIDWHHPYFLPSSMYDPARPHYKEAPAEYRYREPADFKHYLNFAKTQIMELCTMYGPIAGFWFDTSGGVYQHPDLFNIQEVYDMIHAIQPHALVVFKTGVNGNEDFITGEREMGSLAGVFKGAGLPQSVQDAADRAWENNKGKPAELNIPIQTLGWSYTTNPRQRQKSAKEVIQLLDICAKMNANLLLNIGPRPDGTILEENVKTLKEVGEYLDKNGFPPLNVKDYMEYRTHKTLRASTAKENQTAR